MTIEFKLNTSNQESKKGYALIIYVYLNKIKKISTPYHCKIDDWDDVLKEPKRSHPFYFDMIDYVLKTKIKINTILGKPKNYVSINQIESFLANDNPDSFLNFLKNYFEEMKENGKKTWINYSDAYNVLKKYQDEVYFSEIDYGFIVRFRDFKLKNGCKAGGVHYYLRTLRATYNEAVRRGDYKPDGFISPFKGVMPKLEKTQDKHFLLNEMKVLYSNLPPKIRGLRPDYDYHYHNYFLLCFYLGGIDFVDLANLRYDLHVKNGRIQFTRFKGGTSEFIDNLIIPEALEILEKYKDNAPYLINIHKYQYISLRNNYSKRFAKFIYSIKDDNGEQIIESYFTSKTARYTFINLGKQLGLNRDIMMELTGHSRGDVHSIYESAFSYEAKDLVHRKIIDAVLG